MSQRDFQFKKHGRGFHVYEGGEEIGYVWVNRGKWGAMSGTVGTVASNESTRRKAAEAIPPKGDE